MAMTKYRVPTEEEKRIMRRNGIEPEGVVVIFRDEKTIHVVRHKTRDQITITQGEKKW